MFNSKLKFSDTSTIKTVIFRYLIAFWTVGLALLSTLILSPFMQPGISPLFLLAVMISAWRGGLGVGLLATLLSAFASAFIFLPPSFSLKIGQNDWLQVFVFSFAAVVIGSLSASRKRSEVENKKLLIQSQAANAVKDDFLAAVSHELRTPLTTIKTLTRIMQRRETTSEERSEYLKDIATECDRQIDLVHNLLDLSRIKSGRLEIESICTNVEEVIRACEKIERIEANEYKHQLLVEISPTLHFVKADPNALRRALCTIIENAIKFTPKGGQIILRGSNDTNFVIIEIEDTGRGISDDDLPYIFDKFYRGRLAADASDPNLKQSEMPGAGLGLNLARALIKGMNGLIEVKSELGRGSLFIVKLPIWEESRFRKENEISGISSKETPKNPLIESL